MGIDQKKIVFGRLQDKNGILLLEASASDISGQYFVESTAVCAFILDCVKTSSNRPNQNLRLLFILQIYIIMTKNK